MGESKDHECSVSTGIHGGLTFGSGYLDDNGYWQRPCCKCARQHEQKYPGSKAWPFALTLPKEKSKQMRTTHEQFQEVEKLLEEIAQRFLKELAEFCKDATFDISNAIANQQPHKLLDVMSELKELAKVQESLGALLVALEKLMKKETDDAKG